MAGIQVAPGGDGHVLGARAAAADALIDAGAAGEVDHVMVEGEGAAFLPAFQHQAGQVLILPHHDGQILRRQGAGVALGAHHGLHAQFIEAQVQHDLDILEKIRVGMGEGAAHVIVFAAPGRHQLLKFGHDLLPAALARIVHPEAVVDLLAPVQAQHHIAAFPVGKVDHVVVDQHAVGGQGEAEVFALFLFDRAGIGHQVLDHLEVHQRLPAEEIHLQVAAAAAVLHQEIQRLLAHLKGHHGPLAVIFALAGEAIGAIEVAGVGHVQAQSLDHAGGAGLQLPRHVFKGVRGEELAVFLERCDLVVAFRHLGGVLVEALGQFADDLVLAFAFVQADELVGDLVHHVHAAAAGVQHDVIIIQVITVNHVFSFIKNAARRRHSCASFICFLCFRTAGWRCRSWSCRRTGRKSGIRRSRRSWRSRTGCGYQGSECAS